MAGAAASQFRLNMMGMTSNKKYKTDLIGAGWWGNNILGEAMASGVCDITGVCDVDENSNRETASSLEKLMGNRPKTYTDYRELMIEQKPDIAIIATHQDLAVPDALKVMLGAPS